MADGISCTHAKELADCEACLTNKAHRNSHAPTDHRATKVGEVIHFDTGDLQDAISLTGNTVKWILIQHI
jgi:hypothetical protein